jgi:hypothetical protein
VIAVAAVAVALSVLHATSVVVERSASVAPTAEEIFDQGRRARELAPWRLEPVWLCCSAAAASGRDDLAEEGLELLSSSRWLRPRGASLSALASRLHLSRGHLPHALAEAWGAHSERPSIDSHELHFKALRSQLRTPSDDR